MTEPEKRPRMNGSDEPAEMSSPHAIEARASRVRRIVAGVAAVLVLASVPAVGLSRFASANEDVLNETKQDLKHSKHELQKAKDQYRAQTRKIRALQRVMNRLATRISRAEQEIYRIETRLGKLQRQMTKLQVRAALLQAKLDERSREAYMSGGVPVLYVLTATSAADAAARMSFLSELNRRDAVLARKVKETTDRLAQIEAEVVRARQVVELRKRSLELDRKELQRKMAESRRLVSKLSGRIEQIQTEISLLRPFAVCPVGGPHAVADNFGAPRPEPGGGFHWHQGDDIMSETGTPILAPFDGVASVSHSFLGGLGVYVHGEYGYVYNAHLSQLGTLGPVEVGDVVGYVGSTGRSSGPHDHFEWHPENGKAVDPYDFLMLVCGVPL
ncbi:MAG TPA: peptidoglycan DD-metalloendopeptidase family protein [Actinomycetota bacterium]